MKKTIMIIAAMVAAMTAMAETRFYIPDFSIVPGETQTVEIMLDNETAFSALQADIYLPEGLSIEEEDGEYLFDLTSRKARNHTVSSATLSDGGIRILIASQTSKEFSGNSGALVTFNLIADAGLAGGALQIQMKNIIGSEANQTVHNIADASCTVTVEGSVLEPKQVESIATMSCDLPQGIKFRFNVLVSPDDADNKTLQWTTSDAAVATVSADGTIELVGQGDVTITAATTDGSNLTLSYAIHVTEPQQQAGNRYDVNGDGEIDLSDLNMIINAILQK